MSTKKQCCLISGAASDIGIACIEILKSQNIPVVQLINKWSAVLDHSLQDPRYSVDLECEESIAGVMEEIQASHLLTSFISLGGINEASCLESLNGEALCKHFRINTIAPLLIIKNMVPQMVDFGFGRIVLTSSIGVKFGGSISGLAYSISKHAAEFIPAELRSLARRNIYTNVVRIGVTNTRRLRSLGKDLEERREMIPAKRIASPSEIATFLSWLSSQDNSYMSGQVIDYSGGE